MSLTDPKFLRGLGTSTIDVYSFALSLCVDRYLPQNP